MYIVLSCCSVDKNIGMSFILADKVPKYLFVIMKYFDAVCFSMYPTKKLRIKKFWTILTNVHVENIELERMCNWACFTKTKSGNIQMMVVKGILQYFLILFSQ